MPGFPIAVGTGPRHSSSRPFPQDCHVMAMGMNDEETLSATVFIIYNFHPIESDVKGTSEITIGGGGSDEELKNDMCEASSSDANHRHFNVIAELRVQISHSTSPLVSDTDAMSNRETKSRVPLGTMRKRRRTSDRNDDMPHQLLFTPAPSVIFSSNQSHLACLIPNPSGYELVTGHDTKCTSPASEISVNESVSTIIIFTIQTYTISSRQQIRQQNRTMPKLPDYLLDQTNNDDNKNGGNDKTLQSDQSTSSKSQNIYVAHAPKIVRIAQEASSDSDLHVPSLQSATCICDMPSNSNNGKGPEAYSTLLAGITNGSLMVIDFETARVKDILYEHQKNVSLISPIIHLSQCPPTQWKPRNTYGDEMGSESKGRLSAVAQDGGISIFNVTFNASSEQQSSSGIDQTKGFVNKNGLIMELQSLTQFHPTCKSNSSSVRGLRYVCAKWINPMLLAVLTRSPFLDEDLSGQQSSAPTEIVVAQVWSVTEVRGAEKRDDAMPTSNIYVLSELSYPCDNSLIELAHGTFLVTQESENGSSFGTNYSIYKSQRDCLALSSQVVSRDKKSEQLSRVKVRPFCISWDWKRNAQGLTLISDTVLFSIEGHAQLDATSMPPIFSNFLISNDCAIHFYEKTYARMKRLHKDTYNLCTLSPSHMNIMSERGSNVRLCEVSPLILSEDSITYPLMSQPQATTDVSIRWEESKIPSTYVAANGPCRIASIGKDKGHSIAVAASRGLCILDLSRTSWQVSGLQEEHESATPCIKSSSDRGAPASQLLLMNPQWKLFRRNDEQQFRVVSFMWWESSTDDFIFAIIQYISSKAQHLVCWSHKSLGFGQSQLLIDQNDYIASDDGATLVSSDGLQLPNDVRVDSMSILKDPAGSDRALLLLSTISSDDTGCGIDFSLYQLQTKKQSHATSEIVLASLSVHGNIPLKIEVDSITGVFLAGGSFLFDLEAESDNQNCFGVVGITSLCFALGVACVNHTGPILYKPDLLEQDDTDNYSLGAKKSIIASYWISDLSRADRIVWSIARNDGKVYCWAVPCYSYSSSGQSQVEQTGEICYLGPSSLWKNGSTLNGSEVALGPFLSDHFNCTMYSGQSSKTIRCKRGMKSMFSFHVSNCVTAAPQCAPSLFLSFLTLAKHGPSEIGSTEKSHIRMTLRKAKSKNNSSSRSALRIIILKVVEVLDESKGKEDRLQQWNEARNILREVVSVTREVFDELSFAAFFLSVGRQLEPHQFDLMFPLPTNGGRGILVEDLFMVAVNRGSLSVALSGLSLFACHQETHSRVVQLLCHCISKIEKSITLPATFLTEEEKFLHQLYWFGVKLEDAIIADLAQEESTTMFDSGDLGESAINSSTSFDDSSISYASDGDYSDETENQDISFISCRSRNREPEGLVTKVVSRLFQSPQPPKNDSFEEDAIYEAATSFIVSGFDYDEGAMPMPSTEANSTCNDETNHCGNDSFRSTFASVAGSTAKFLSHAIGFNCNSWISAGKIAHLIQGDRETTAISRAAASYAIHISRLVTVDELSDVCTLFNHPASLGQNAHNQVASCLEHLTLHCYNQLHSDETAGTILNLVLLLLLRHEICEDVQLHRSELIMIGIVCGHLSGRITDIVDQKAGDCDVYLIYQALSHNNKN